MNLQANNHSKTNSLSTLDETSSDKEIQDVKGDLKKFKGEQEKRSRRLEYLTFGIFSVAIIALGGVFVTVAAIYVDISKDVSRYDSLRLQITDSDKQIRELNKNILELQKESLRKESILNCIEKTGNKYWEYKECFNK